MFSFAPVRRQHSEDNQAAKAETKGWLGLGGLGFETSVASRLASLFALWWWENLWLWIRSSSKCHSLLLTSRKVHLGTMILGKVSIYRYPQIYRKVKLDMKNLHWRCLQTFTPCSPIWVLSPAGRRARSGARAEHSKTWTSEHRKNTFFWPGCTFHCPPSDQKGCSLCKYDINPSIGHILHLTVRFWIQGCWLT